MKNLRSGFLALGYTVRRCAGVFFKDGLSVFLALLAPIIVFLLYVLFLGDMQSDALQEYFPAGMADERAVSAFVDSWMIAGVLGTACITVSFSANNIMVGDRERGVVNDFIAAPMKKSVLLGAYFVFNFLVTAAICTIVFFIGLIYLAATHSFYMSAADVFSAFGTILYGSLSATLISVPVCASFKTQGALGGFSGIVSAAIGFLIGAYMPLSTFPSWIENAAAVLPGTHISGLFRNFFMSGALENLTAGMPDAVANSIAESFSMKFLFFGDKVGVDVMAGYVSAWIVVCAVGGLVIGTRLLDAPAALRGKKTGRAVGNDGESGDDAAKVDGNDKEN